MKIEETNAYVHAFILQNQNDSSLKLHTETCLDSNMSELESLGYAIKHIHEKLSGYNICTYQTVDVAKNVLGNKLYFSR